MAASDLQSGIGSGPLWAFLRVLRDGVSPLAWWVSGSVGGPVAGSGGGIVRVEHVREPGKPGTVLEADVVEGVLLGALVLWDDHPEPEYQWGSKLVEVD